MKLGLNLMSLFLVPKEHEKSERGKTADVEKGSLAVKTTLALQPLLELLLLELLLLELLLLLSSSSLSLSSLLLLLLFLPKVSAAVVQAHVQFVAEAVVLQQMALVPLSSVTIVQRLEKKSASALPVALLAQPLALQPTGVQPACASQAVAKTRQNLVPTAAAAAEGVRRAAVWELRGVWPVDGVVLVGRCLHRLLHSALDVGAAFRLPCVVHAGGSATRAAALDVRQAARSAQSRAVAERAGAGAARSAPRRRLCSR